MYIPNLPACLNLSWSRISQYCDLLPPISTLNSFIICRVFFGAFHVNVGWLASDEGASAIVKSPAHYLNTRLLIILIAVAEL